MAATQVKVQMQQRRDVAAGWTSADPTLLSAELGYETDTGKFKIGDGTTAWSSLSYIPGFSVSAYPLATADIADDAVNGDKLADDITIANDLTVTNNLTVNGTTTTINSTTLQVDDKNIELGTVATPSDTTADGGGITLKGATDHTIIWTNSTDSWDFSEHVNIASGKEFRIAGTKVLDATSLGSAVVSSSLTSVGTIGTGVWNGTPIAAAYLANTAVTAGTYTAASITVDAQGRLTSASSNTIPTNNNQLTNGAGYITSADGGNADTVDSLHASSFLRSDAADSFSGALTGSGTISVTGTSIECGRTSGSVAMTTNDGYGNANLCFNHKSGVPDFSGSSCRIKSAVDSTTGNMVFDIANSVTSGAAAATTETLKLTTSTITYKSNTVWHAGNFDPGSIPQNAKTAAYTLLAADAGKHISITTGGVTVPSGVFSIGDAVTIYNNSTSNQTITQGSSVTLRIAGSATSGNKTLAQYGLCTILCVASNVFVVGGAGVS